MEEKIRLAVFGQKRLSREGGIEIVVKELCTRMAQNVLYLTKKYRTDYHKVNARFTYQTIKDVIRGRKQFAPVRCAYRDYLKGNMGKWGI